MTRRFKWLIPILILCLVLMSLPAIGCTPGDQVYLLIYSVLCGIEVYAGGNFQGTLEFMAEWGLCMLNVLWTEGEDKILRFVVPGSVLAEAASAHGMQLTASQASEMPDITLTYKGVIAHDGRLEFEIRHPIVATTLALNTGLSNQNEPPLLGSIVVETSSEPFEPHLLVYPTISCEPSSFTVMLHPNTACSNTMRIGNEEDAILTYDLYDRSEATPNELVYDDGECDSWGWMGVIDEHHDFRKAVRFTPPAYPVYLDTASLCLALNSPDSDHEEFAVEVYDDDGASGAPGSLLGTVYTTPTDWGWWSVDISGLGIAITSGDFYIAYRQLTYAPDCEALCYDNSEPHYYRSWAKSWVGDQLWMHIESDENYMIRCVVEIAEDCPWLSESPKSGSVEPSNWDDITITVDASGLAPGDYSAEIIISNNDPDKNPVTVPVTLLVNNPPSTLRNPIPTNHATNLAVDADLGWTGGDPDAGDTVAYEVYFGTSPSPPYEGSVGPHPATETAMAYDPGILDNDTTYYWSIIATDNHEVSAIGSIWDFTTAGEWDAWVYDEDESGYIEIGELLTAISDYIGGDINISQLLEVISLYISHTHNEVASSTGAANNSSASATITMTTACLAGE